jgi:hypothetical protein
MEADLPSRAQYLAEAERARDLADKADDEDMRRELLVIAEVYEQLAVGVSRATSTLLN